GMMHYQQPALVVDRTGGTWWRGFKALFALGLRHIREGTDHLLFLLLLLLPAPLVAERKRWGAAVGARRSLLQTGKIVTAFTLGHSLTLVLGALWGAELPAAPVEIAIALSILVSAVHALWPLFAGREALVAGSFGLVHGLAFAAVLAGFGFDGTSLAVSVLGFNLGVEAMQLAIIALVMPWLAPASRSAHYRFLRLFGACFGFVAAAGWLAERAFGLHTRVPGVVEAVAAHAPWLGVALVPVALLCNSSVAYRRSPR
ncbi:MAG TPA: HupE/UreJ family protein, partial [Polyangiaceae bacterium]|nr:HupE/UreJ family protein [Polyangiaceae bacterium]